MKQTVTMAGREHVFDSSVLGGDLQSILVGLAEWGMIMADADRELRAAESQYRNWRAAQASRLVTASSRRNCRPPEWQVRSHVDSLPEYPTMRERIANAEANAERVRSVCSVLKIAANALVPQYHDDPPPEDRHEIPAENCEPGQQYEVHGRAMTFRGIASLGARFREQGGDITIALVGQQTVEQVEMLVLDGDAEQDGVHALDAERASLGQSAQIGTGADGASESLADFAVRARDGRKRCEKFVHEEISLWGFVVGGGAMEDC